MSPARQRASIAEQETEAGLSIDVVFTSVRATLGALRKAAALADRLNARIHLVVPQVVPFPCPLTSPPTACDFNERRLRIIAGESRIPTTVLIYLCRDPWETLKSVLRPHSLVVVGGRRRWWTTAEDRLAAKLRRSGYDVIFTETE
jgi:hypothetical protein